MPSYVQAENQTQTQIKIDQLGAVHTSLGKAVADVDGYEAELAALQKEDKEPTRQKDKELTRQKDKELTRQKEFLQRESIDPVEEKLAGAKAIEGTTSFRHAILNR